VLLELHSQRENFIFFYAYCLFFVQSSTFVNTLRRLESNDQVLAEQKNKTEHPVCRLFFFINRFWGSKERVRAI
jgi:hypothetical protein